MEHQLNRRPLPNLRIKRKIVSSALLGLGLLFYAGSWLVVLELIYGLEQNGDSLGVSLGVLWFLEPRNFMLLFLVHAVGMFVLLRTALSLFNQTSMRRRVRILLIGLAVLFSLLDLAAWSYSPWCSSTNMYVGISGIVAGIPLIVLGLIPLAQLWVYKRWESPRLQRVVIVGGGFAGLYAARGLEQKLGYHPQLQITLIDKNNFFLFPPLLPSAAAGTIETRQVTYPFRRIFENSNIVFRKAEVKEIVPEARQVVARVETCSGAVGSSDEVVFDYDYLVLAPGATTQTFNTEGVEDYAYFMRELGDAIRLRDRVIDCFERAAVLRDQSAQAELLSFVVIGGGPTGVETATEIQDLIQQILLKRYPEIDPKAPQVSIVQSGEHVLPGWDKHVVQNAERQLAKLNIPLRLGARVMRITPRTIELNDGTIISSQTAIWCAGVKPSQLLANSCLSLDPSGRVPVDAELRSHEFKNVFILGDSAACVDQKTGKVLPPLGQVAFQQGSHTAKNLKRLLLGQTPLPFRYFDFGSLVSVGEHYAAVNLLGIKLTGFLGWLVWRSLYLGKIVGVSNKIRIIIDWTLDLLIERSITQLPKQHTR